MLKNSAQTSSSHSPSLRGLHTWIGAESSKSSMRSEDIAVRIWVTRLGLQTAYWTSAKASMSPRFTNPIGSQFTAVIDNIGDAVLSWVQRLLADGGLLAAVGHAIGNSFGGSVLSFIADVRHLGQSPVAATVQTLEQARWRPEVGPCRLAARSALYRAGRVIGACGRQREGRPADTLVVRFGAAG